MVQTSKNQGIEVWKQFFETSETIRNFYDKNMAIQPKKELTISQLRVMSCIFFHESGVMRIKDIAEELGITAGGVSQSVDGLVNSGLLIRGKDEHDRRAVAVELSEYGKKVRAEVYEDFGGMFLQFLDGISEDNLKIFQETLRIIFQNAKKTKKQ